MPSLIASYLRFEEFCTHIVVWWHSIFKTLQKYCLTTLVIILLLDAISVLVHYYTTGTWPPYDK